MTPFRFYSHRFPASVICEYENSITVVKCRVDDIRTVVRQTNLGLDEDSRRVRVGCSLELPTVSTTCLRCLAALPGAVASTRAAAAAQQLVGL